MSYQINLNDPPIFKKDLTTKRPLLFFLQDVYKNYSEINYSEY